MSATDRFTEQQSAIINGRGNLLVVAGAGTGKTHTLIGRCVRLITVERVSVEELLLVTFTEAAAAELRARLREELLRLQHAHPDDTFLAEQTALLETACIGTLHSFCLRLTRAHFHLLGLDPSFGVLDEQQTGPLQREVLDELLEENYSSDNAFARSVHDFIRTTGKGDDGEIRKLVRRVHAFARSLPDPDGWLTEQEQFFAETEPAVWHTAFTEAVAVWRDEWIAELAGEFEMEAPAVTAALATLHALPKQPTLAEASAAVAQVVAADADKANWPRGSVTKVRQGLKKFFEQGEFLAGYALQADGTDPLAQEWARARVQMTTLLGLVREFGERFTVRKRELGGVDFADLEQLALQLLRVPEVAATWRARFAHVCVDEYQDINAAQDAILSTLGRPGDGNRFLVGDMKQSIYRFRLADPKIFQAYRQAWPGALVLTENFRSRSALLGFVNPLFAALMRPDTAGMGYDALEFGAPEARSALAAKPGDAPLVELHLIAKPEDAPEEAPLEADADSEAEPAEDTKNGQPDLMAVEREARLVARRLRELHTSGHKIWDKKLEAFRAVKWSDMAVLLRSPNGRAEAFAIEFSHAGVPLVAARAGFFASQEVGDLLALLRVLDNPLQDIALVAVLRSPLVGLSPDELAEIRTASRQELYWTTLQNWFTTKAAAWPATQAKVGQFLAHYARWRELIRHTSLSQTLETALTETHYEALLAAGTRGPERLGNLRKLLDLARQFDPFQRQGLYRFLRHVEAQQDEDNDLEPATPPADDCVRLISIHKSKGLEFPVVALAGIGTRFNESDLRGLVLLDESLGLCPRITPAGSERSHQGLAHWVAQRQGRRELRAEELRLLYVALTRARDRLILVGTSAKQVSQLRWSACPDPIPASKVVNANSHLDWLLTWLPRHAEDTDWSNERAGATRLLSWQIHDTDAAEFAHLAQPDIAPVTEANPPEGALAALQQRLTTQYPHPEATTRSGKSTVSVLRREAQTDDGAEQWFTPPRPRRAPTSKLSAADAGTANHKLLQLLDLSRVATEFDLRTQASALVEDGTFTPEEHAALDFGALADFWQTDFGQRVRRADESAVHREIQFFARLSGDDLRELGLLEVESKLAGEEFIVVQGAVDLAVIFPKREIWLVDFKTDDVDETQVEARADKYRPQLLIYARALARIYGATVTDCRLHFLKLRRSIPVEL